MATVRRLLLILVAIWLCLWTVGDAQTVGPQSLIAVRAETYVSPLDPSPDTMRAFLANLDGWWRAASNGRSWLMPRDVVSTYPTYDTTTCTAVFGSRSQMVSSTEAQGYAYYDYAYRLLWWPTANNWGCSGSGGEGFVGGSEPYIRLMGDLITALPHELGHNNGSAHALSYNCGPSTIFRDGCGTWEYNDPYDVMGHGGWTTYAVPFLQRLGWAPVQTVTASGDYAIGVLDDGVVGALPEGLQLPFPDDTAHGNAPRSLYIEYRRQAGHPLFRFMFSYNSTATFLLDMTPEDNDFSAWTQPDTAHLGLPIGRTFAYETAGYGHVSITPLSIDPVGGATLRIVVDVDNPPCQDANASNVGQPLPCLYPPLAIQSLTVTATSPDGLAVPVDYTLPTVTGGKPTYQESCYPPSGFAWPVGVWTVTCGAQDALGQSVVGTVTITVTTAPAPVPVECVQGDWYVVSTSTATTDWVIVGDHYERTTTTTITWQRDTLTPPSNGGVPCGPPTQTTTSSIVETAPLPALTLTARPYRVRNSNRVDLAWANALTTAVTLSRNAVSLGSTPNDGAYTDALGKKSGGTSYVYRLCESGAPGRCVSATVAF